MPVQDFVSHTDLIDHSAIEISPIHIGHSLTHLEFHILLPVYVCVCVFVCVHVYVCVCVHVYICIFVCVCVFMNFNESWVGGCTSPFCVDAEGQQTLQ